MPSSCLSVPKSATNPQLMSLKSWQLLAETIGGISAQELARNLRDYRNQKLFDESEAAQFLLAAGQLAVKYIYTLKTKNGWDRITSTRGRREVALSISRDAFLTPTIGDLIAFLDPPKSTHIVEGLCLMRGNTSNARSEVDLRDAHLMVLRHATYDAALHVLNKATNAAQIRTDVVVTPAGKAPNEAPKQSQTTTVQSLEGPTLTTEEQKLASFQRYLSMAIEDVFTGEPDENSLNAVAAAMAANIAADKGLKLSDIGEGRPLDKARMDEALDAIAFINEAQNHQDSEEYTDKLVADVLGRIGAPDDSTSSTEVPIPPQPAPAPATMLHDPSLTVRVAKARALYQSF